VYKGKRRAFVEYRPLMLGM